MNYWILVLGEVEGLRWVLSRQRMAFTQGLRSRAAGVAPGDRLLVYVTRGAYHDPTRDRSQFLALGQATSVLRPLRKAFDLAGRRFTSTLELKFELVLPERQGLPAESLAPRLGFIHRKDQWGQYFRSGLIEIGREDFLVVARALANFASQQRPVTPIR